MKNVWILNHYAQEPGAGGGTRHFDLAKNLKSFGWTASIIAAGTEHNTGRQRVSGLTSRLDNIDGVNFLWISTPGYEGNGSARLKNMLAYTVRSLSSSVTSQLPRPDAIIGSSVHPLAGVAGAMLASRHKVPFYFEVRDLWPETLIDMGRISRNGLTARIMRRIEGYLYRRASKIITLLPNAHDYIGRFNIAREKVVWIPNGVELGRFPPPVEPRLKDQFSLMYFGAHGGANGLGNLIEAMRLIQDEPVRLRLIGDGPEKEQLRNQADGLSNISFEAPVPKSEIPRLASEADAFVFNLIDAPVFKYGISSNKLFDFMASGRPIIFACHSSNNPVADAGAGFTIPPESPEDLAEAIKTMMHTPHQRRWEMGLAARRFVEENHHFAHLAHTLANVLNTR